MGNCAAGRTETDGAVGFMVGNFIKRFCTIAWCLTGLAGVAYFAGGDINPDELYGMVARDFLPAGVLGVFLATLLASVMSSCDSFMIASSALFTENVYKRVRPNLSEKHYILIARIASLVIVVGGIFFAYAMPDVRTGLEIFWKIAPMMGIAFWLGLFWRRTSVAGAWASCLVALGTWYLTSRAFFVDFLAALPFQESCRFLFEKDGVLGIYLPWQMVFYLAAGTAAGIIVSLFTKQVDSEKLDHFYSLIRTPVKQGEQLEKPCTLPEGVEVPPRRVLFPNSNIEIPKPSPRAVIGFAIGWGFVAMIIYAFAMIAAS